MFKKVNIKAIRESLALLVIAAIVGTIVSFVAQLFIISAKNIYDFCRWLRQNVIGHLLLQLHLSSNSPVRGKHIQISARLVLLDFAASLVSFSRLFTLILICSEDKYAKIIF